METLIITVTNSNKGSVSVTIKFLFKVTKKTFQEIVHSSLTLEGRINKVSQHKRHKCLILMLNLKVSKQTRREASKNKVTKRVSNISIN